MIAAPRAEKGDREASISGRDNLNTIRLIEAGYRSAAEHRTVRLDEIPLLWPKRLPVPSGSVDSVVRGYLCGLDCGQLISLAGEVPGTPRYRGSNRDPLAADAQIGTCVRFRLRVRRSQSR